MEDSTGGGWVFQIQKGFWETRLIPRRTLSKYLPRLAAVPRLASSRFQVHGSAQLASRQPVPYFCIDALDLRQVLMHSGFSQLQVWGRCEGATRRFIQCNSLLNQPPGQMRFVALSNPQSNVTSALTLIFRLRHLQLHRHFAFGSKWQKSLSLISAFLLAPHESFFVRITS